MATQIDKSVFLASAKDWKSWNSQFQAQAVAGSLWSQIQGLTPFLAKLTALNPAHYKHKASSQFTAQDFYRLFLALGGDYEGAGIAVSDEDSLDYIVDWVEHRRANETLRAAGTTRMGDLAQRDICQI